MTRPDVSPESVTLVKVPAAGVVAPTVPLIFILAVPVRFVTVPDDGVPSAPPFVTKAPEDPTLTPRAVATPVPRPVIDPTAGVTVVFPAAVISPFPFTVKVPTCVAEPNDPTFAFTVASVPAAVTLPDPSNDGDVYVKSPVMDIVLPVARAVAVVAFPDKAAVMVPAEKLPELSRMTSADAVFALATPVPVAVPLMTGVVSTALVRVLFVSVWLVVLSTVMLVSMAMDVPVMAMPLPPVNDPCPAVCAKVTASVPKAGLFTPLYAHVVFVCVVPELTKIESPVSTSAL